MPIFNINFNNFWLNNLPSRKRTTKRIARGAVYMKPLQWLHDIILGTYSNGDFGTAAWSNATTYAVGDRVNYGKSIYECWTIPPTGTPPIDTNYWVLVQEKFTGINGRVQQTASKLIFEYALNEWFGTTFRQPVVGLSDIYITQNTAVNAVFFVGLTESESSNAVYENGEATAFINAENVSIAGVAHFTINMPVAVYTALGSTSLIREKTVRRFADSINLAGINYDIVTY